MTDLILDENQIPEIHHLNLLDKLRIQWRDWALRWSEMEKKKKVLVGSLAVGLIVFVVSVGTLLLAKTKDANFMTLNNKNPLDLEIKEPEEPKDHVAPLTGEMISKSEYEKLVSKLALAVIVENHPDARPQSGLDQADLVYETLVEGGITRFVPIYLSKEPEVVGPVRSIRKYFLDLAAGLDDPLIMHIGGAVSSNPQANALAEIQKYGMKSLGIMGGNFWRVGSRHAPHNAYISTKQLWEKAADLEWDRQIAIRSWRFKDPIREITNIEADRIQVHWNGWGETLWSVSWQFDESKNEYLRFHQTQEHIDAVTEKQLTARNIAVIFAPQYLANDGTSRIVYDLTRQGKSLVFRDGKVIEGKWGKLTRTDRLIFKDSLGEEVVFNRGVSWIMVVPVGSEVSY